MGLRAPIIRAGLYLVATPIGTSTDISLRALDLISKADVLVAEDKRNLLRLMKIHLIKLGGRPLLSYYDHNAQEQRPKILSILKDQKSVVFVSDAGTPLIADPGYKLVLESISSGFYVSVVPGASALLAALTISGLPTDKFFFGGFIPTKIQAKKVLFKKYLNLSATIIFYESPLRLGKTLAVLCSVCDTQRQIVVCRELTKKFEDVQRGTLKEVSQYFAKAGKVKGEIVLLLGPPKSQVFVDEQLDGILIDAREYLSFKDTVSFVSKRLNLSKKTVYARALSIEKTIN